MCERPPGLREVEAPTASGAGGLVCVECGARSVDGADRKAEVAPDLLARIDDEGRGPLPRVLAGQFRD
jgi:hypothetical protein